MDNQQSQYSKLVLVRMSCDCKEFTGQFLDRNGMYRCIKCGGIRE